MEWGFTEEQDIRISNVVKDLESEIEIMEEWLRRIQQVIQFPFYTKVTEWQDDRSIVQEGDLLKVHAIGGDIDDKYGIIANTRIGRKKLYFPYSRLI